MAQDTGIVSEDDSMVFNVFMDEVPQLEFCDALDNLEPNLVSVAILDTGHGRLADRAAASFKLHAKDRFQVCKTEINRNCPLL